MALFQGNYLTGGISNHIFKSNDPDFEALGLHSFTLYSCSEIWNANKDSIQMVYNGTYTYMNAGDTIFNQLEQFNGSPPDGTCIFYDKNSQSILTIKKTYDEWKQIIEYYENKFANPSYQISKIYDDTIKAVKTSINKGVVFTFSRSALSNSITGDVSFLLCFLERKLVDDKDKDLRIGGIPTSVPSITIPQTITGNEYSIRNLQLEGNSIGKKQSILEGGIKNPHNTVAASVDYFLNEATGKLESGTRRMLATLLTDIEPAPIKTINIGPSDLNRLTSTDFTDNNSDTFTSYNPPTGLAMPIGVQNNNPNLLTPNFCKKCIKDENGNIVSNGYFPESVVVTNRFNKTFKKGTTVFLTRIGKEWIPEEQVQDSPSASLKIGEWSFCKLIADSDNYFKDNSWATSNPQTWSSRNFSPTDYEKAARYKFYSNVIERLGSSQYQDKNSDKTHYYLSDYYPNRLLGPSNLGNEDTSIKSFSPSQRYYISTIFDQLSTGVGGWQDYSWINRTNMNKGEFDAEKKHREIGMFWGPVYTDGYKNIVINDNYSTGTSYINTTGINKQLYPNSFFAITKGVTRSNGDDNTYIPQTYDIPAECTSYIIDPIGIFANFDSLGRINSSQVITKNIIPPYQASVKTNNNKIQFIPLTSNLVGYNDLNANNTFNSFERNFYNRGREFFSSYYVNSQNFANKSIWGNMFNRTVNRFWPPSYRGYLGVAPKCQLNNNISFNSQSSEKLVTYDCYIVRDPIDIPVGNPESMFDDNGLSKGGNCVGIICGKTTISKRNGGDINLSVTSNFGLPPFSQVTPGNVFLGILPIGGIPVPLLTSNDVRQTTGRPQFGSYSDDIQSFGTTSLSVRIFDAWPSGSTIFDPRYFAVLHFNSGDCETLPDTEEIKFNIDESPIYIDKISTSVDFRIPTWSGNMLPRTYDIVPIGTKIDSTNKRLFYNYDQWKVNPIRRGMLLTNGGFTYYKHKIGVFIDDISIKVDTNYVDVTTGQIIRKEFKGKKYKENQEYVLKNKLKIKINKVDPDGGIINFEIAKDNNIEQNGEFLHTDIPFEFTLPQPVDSNGNKIPGSESAVFFIKSGTVYLGKEIDLPPSEQVPTTRISSSSNAGKQDINNETKTTTFNLTTNNTGKYDVFTHFHNDITHTILYHPVYGDVKLQYISMDMA